MLRISRLTMLNVPKMFDVLQNQNTFIGYSKIINYSKQMMSYFQHPRSVETKAHICKIGIICVYETKL